MKCVQNGPSQEGDLKQIKAKETIQLSLREQQECHGMCVSKIEAFFKAKPVQNLDDPVLGVGFVQQ